MANKKKKTVKANNGANKFYSVQLALTLIIGSLLLSFADVMFLSEVVGQIVGIGTTSSAATSFGLGLIGIAMMAHLGVQEAHNRIGKNGYRLNIGIWLTLGIIFALIRLFSATILNLEDFPGEETLMSIGGMNVRQIDLILAPLMFMLHLATGLMMHDGVKNLLLNPDFEKHLDERKTRRMKKSKETEEASILAAENQRKVATKKVKEADDIKIARAKEVASQAKIDAANKVIDDKRVADEKVKAALIADHKEALSSYDKKLSEIKTKYKSISANIDYVKNIDKDEEQFESKVKPSLMKVVDSSIDSTQGSVALAVRQVSGEEMKDLREVISRYNKNQRG